MDSFEMDDQKKFGLAFTGFGIFLSFFGIILFFNKALLAMGNTLFVCGVSLTIGLNSTMQFIMKQSNFKGTISFGIGFFLIVIKRWPILGMIIEAYGFLVLLSDFWPTIAIFLRMIRVLGRLFLQPFIQLNPIALWVRFYLQWTLTTIKPGSGKHTGKASSRSFNVL
ncbi:vesicle transport protein GOT1-like [Cicer arietinum]|uniref:Vesicle transport protein GOT1-like n=1 Tax=Cicer arietinum TaxID=3827 RepID=A0A1S2XLT7_CICAR|nr:vesicle transport protein GOT1-like [Cicer arietinum]